MAIKTGTHTIADLTANTFASTLVQEFGYDNLNTAIQADLDMHNARTGEMLSDLCELNDERSTIYGTNADADMHKKDEFTRGPTQKITRGSKVEFPLDAFQIAVGWTADYLRRATVQDMALATIARRQAHLRIIQNEIRNAFFGATNYTFTDRWTDSIDLAVKRLVNADSGLIPNGPNGETFDGATHMHYDAIDWTAATGAQKTAFIRALIADLIEHGHGDDVRIYINRAQEADFRAPLAGFSPLIVPNIELRTTEAPVQRLDISKADNRLIGYFDGIAVWTKPWVPASYVLAFSAGAEKPLRFRQPTGGQPRGLYVAGNNIAYPMQAEYMEAYFGVGVKTRTNGVVGYLGGGAYVSPSF